MTLFWRKPLAMRALAMLFVTLGMIGMHQLPSMALSSGATAEHHAMTQHKPDENVMSDMAMVGATTTHCSDEISPDGSSCHSMSHACQAVAADEFELIATISVLTTCGPTFGTQPLVSAAARPTSDPPNLVALSISRI